MPRVRRRRSATIGGGLNGPIGVVFDSEGDIYVAGGLTGSVHKYDGQSGEFIHIFARVPSSTNATGLVFGPNGNLFVGSGSRRAVYEYHSDGSGLIGAFASGNGLTSVIGIAFDEDGIFYVSSFDDDAVLRFDSSGTFIDKFISTRAGGLDGSHFFLFIDTPVPVKRSSFGSLKRRF